MNIFSFIGLLKSIYGKKLPNLGKIQAKGLLAVKIAQHFALRIDFLDENVCRHLAKLFNEADSVASVDLNNIIEKNAAPEWLNNFEYLEMQPFASASVGQVHFAKLKTGEDVVVKLIKQDFRDSFLRDIKRLENMFKFILLFYPKLRKVFDPLGILNFIKEYTIEELDLRNEIKGKEILDNIKSNYSKIYDFTKLKLVNHYPEYSNANILISDKIIGNTFRYLLDNNALSYNTLLDLFAIHGFYLFKMGTFHGDLHPGNIFLGDDKYIYFIDTAAITSISDRIRTGLFDFFAALVDYDYELCCIQLHKMSVVTINNEKFEKFRNKLLILYKDFKGKSVSEVSLTKKMMETIKLGVNSGMDFEKGMFSIIKSMMYLDGMVIKCNPQAVLIDDMKPYIKNFKRIIDNNE
jgi:ubiquinone biosynthesis protein